MPAVCGGVGWGAAAGNRGITWPAQSRGCTGGIRHHMSCGPSPPPAQVRAARRIAEGRAKPIDLLTKNLYMLGVSGPGADDVGAGG